MDYINATDTLKAWLEQTVPCEIVFAVETVISKDKDAREAGAGTKATIEMVIPTSWKLGDIIERLSASNSPKVAVASEYRGTTVPSRFRWTINKKGEKRARKPISKEAHLRAAFGDARFEALLAKFGTPERIFEAVSSLLA